MKTIFCPLLKTKRVSEKNAVLALKETIEKRDDVIPYFELIQDSTDSVAIKYLTIFDKSSFFAEPKNNDELASLFAYDYLIPVFNVTTQTKPSEINEFITTGHNNSRPIGIRIVDSDVRFFGLVNRLLLTNDYLFIDIDKNDYKASSFLLIVNKLVKVYKTIIISNERSISYSGKEFSKYDESFPTDKLFNVSVISSIKDGSFGFDGFGSYCAAKNDLTEEIKIAVTVFGYFLIFDFKQNNFFVSSTEDSEHISKVYNNLIDKIYSTGSDVLTLVSSTPISKGMLDDAYAACKLSCPRKITIEITHYIEEIIKQLDK